MNQEKNTDAAHTVIGTRRMLAELAEQQHVMEAFLKGEKILVTRRNVMEPWKPIEDPIWDWNLHVYKVAPPPPKTLRAIYAPCCDDSSHEPRLLAAGSAESIESVMQTLPPSPTGIYEVVDFVQVLKD